jgi:hypothetical protein
MPRTEFQSDHTTGAGLSGSKSMSERLADDGRKIGNVSLQAQSEFIKTLGEIGRQWVMCTTAEVEIGLKLSKKLTAAHSVPDAMSAYQEWLSDEINARAEDTRRFMTNGQRFMDSSARLFSNNFSVSR